MTHHSFRFGAAALTLLFFGLATAGCGRPTAPPRDSPELVAFGESGEIWASHFDRGVTLMTLRDEIDAPQRVVRLTTSGFEELRVSPEAVTNICAISERAGVLIGETNILIFDGAADVVSSPIGDVVGDGVADYEIACAGRATDDVWVLGSRDTDLVLAHWDGSIWEREEPDLAAPPFEGIAVTNGYLWITAEPGIMRRPIDGRGAFEMVSDTSAWLYAVDDTTVLEDDDYFDAILYHDDGTSEVLERPTDPGDVVVTPDGSRYQVEIDTDGETITSFGGSSSAYYPYWASLVVRDATDGSSVELGHFSENYREGSDATLPSMWAYPVGNEVVVVWGASLYRLR